MRDRLVTVRALLVLVVATVLLAVTGAPVHAAKPVPSSTSSTAPPVPRAYVVLDADTGEVVLAKDDRTPLPPASLTKVLTAVAAAPLLDREGTIPVSARAAAQPANKVGADEGQRWATDVAMHVMLLRSANDLAMAVAEQAGGSAEGFQEVMDKAATRLGMADGPVLRDPAGLDDSSSVGGGNLVSARDLAIATRALLADPWLGPIVAKRRFGFTAPDGTVHDAVNHNKLVLGGGYPGALGVKTGFTRRAGRTLIGAARRDGRTLIAVVLNVYDTYGWVRTLLDQGFSKPAGDAGLGRVAPLVRLEARDVAVATSPRAAVPPPAQVAVPIEASTVAATAGGSPPPLLGIGLAAGVLVLTTAFATRARRRPVHDPRTARRRRARL